MPEEVTQVTDGIEHGAETIDTILNKTGGEFARFEEVFHEAEKLVNSNPDAYVKSIAAFVSSTREALNPGGESVKSDPPTPPQKDAAENNRNAGEPTSTIGPASANEQPGGQLVELSAKIKQTTEDAGKVLSVAQVLAGGDIGDSEETLQGFAETLHDVKDKQKRQQWQRYIDELRGRVQSSATLRPRSPARITTRAEALKRLGQAERTLSERMTAARLDKAIGMVKGLKMYGRALPKRNYSRASINLSMNSVSCRVLSIKNRQATQMPTRNPTRTRCH